MQPHTDRHTTSTAPRRGDEADLYRRHHQVLLIAVAHAINGSPQLVEDACQTAWTILVRRQLIAEGEKVVGRFRCSGTNLGPWRGKPPTGRRFERVDEVYIYRVCHGRIAEAWGIEDNRSRERQLGLSARR